MPLPFFNKMILHATQKEIEEKSYPLWLVHVLLSQINGNGKIIPIEEMFGFSNKKQQKLRTKEEIENDFLKIVEKQRKEVDRG